MEGTEWKKIILYIGTTDEVVASKKRFTFLNIVFILATEFTDIEKKKTFLYCR